MVTMFLIANVWANAATMATQPQAVGPYNTVEECKAAAKAAGDGKIVFNNGVTGAPTLTFVCVASKK